MVTIRASGARDAKMATFVIMPSVPSAPINNCFKSYPVLSFLFSLSKELNTVPSARTTSKPKTVPRKEPYLTRRKPPAFVDTLPPI